MPTINSGFSDILTILVGEKVRLDITGSVDIAMDGVTTTLTNTVKDYGKFTSNKRLHFNNVRGSVVWNRVSDIKNNNLSVAQQAAGTNPASVGNGKLYDENGNEITSISIHPAVHNLKRENTVNSRAAIKASREGGSPVVAVIHSNSDSMGAGAGSGGADYTNNSWQFSYHRLLAAYISGLGGMQASAESILGNSYSPVAYGTYNPRVTLGANWGTGGFGPGGNLFTHANIVNDPYDYQHQGIGELITVFYNEGNQTFNRPFQVLVNDIVIDTVTPAAGTETFTAKSYDIGFLVNPKISIKTTTANNSQIFGVEVYQRNSKILIRGACLYGEQAQSLSTILSSRVGAKMVHTEMQINDSNSNKAKATYKSQLEAHINSVLNNGGDITIGTQARSNTVYATNGKLAELDDAVYELANQYGIPYIDAKEIYGATYAIANTAGLMRDDKHTTLIAKKMWAAAYGSMWQWMMANSN